MPRFRPKLLRQPRTARIVRAVRDNNDRQDTPNDTTSPHSVDAPRTWKGKRGDRYIAVVTRIVGSPDAGYSFLRTHADEVRTTLERAIRDGFPLADDTDDFNVWVFRGGQLKATLWMNEVVDDDPDVLARLREEAGL